MTRPENKAQIVKLTPRPITIQNVQEYEAAIADLSEGHVLALQELAAYSRPSAIRIALDKAGLGDDVTDSWIEAQSSPAKRSAKYRAIIGYLRGQMADQLAEIPIASPIYRLRELQKIADNTPDEKVRLVALREAHQQAQDLAADGREDFSAEGSLLDALAAFQNRGDGQPSGGKTDGD